MGILEILLTCIIIFIPLAYIVGYTLGQDKSNSRNIMFFYLYEEDSTPSSPVLGMTPNYGKILRLTNTMGRETLMNDMRKYVRHFENQIQEGD